MITWKTSGAPVPYPDAEKAMEGQVSAILSGQPSEGIWFLEHPDTYTAGTSADPGEILDPRFPVYPSGRGGRHTWHGPGQRVIYVMLDIRRRGISVHEFVHGLEGWGIAALAELGLAAFRRDGHVGIWVGPAGREEKIAAIGVRVRRGITFHGMAINVCPDLAAFSGIVPCGISDRGVTSLAACGLTACMADLDRALRETCPWSGAPLKPGP